MTAINTAPLKAETGLVGKVVTQELSTTGTTLYVRFEDSKTGVARTPQATTKLFTLDKDNDRFEIIFADSHSTTDGITTITINANGRAVLKYGGLNGGATGNRHPLNAEVGCVDVHTYNGVLADILNGTNPTYAQTFKVGDGTANDIILYFIDNQGTPSFIMKDSGTGKILMSNDGVNTFDPEAGGSGVTAGDGISITGGAVAVDTTDTAVFAKTDGDVAEDKVPVMGATGVIADRAMHATLNISDITATATQINDFAGRDIVDDHYIYTPAYLTTGTSATSNYLLWLGTTDGSFACTIDGVARNITGLDFSGATDMDDIASVIQAGVRAITSGNETCVWSTNKFILTSGNTTSSSAITVLSAVGSGTDISGATAGDPNMDGDTGNGTVTNKAINNSADAGKIAKLNSEGNINRTLLQDFDAKGDLFIGTGNGTGSMLSVGTNGKILMADSSQPTGLKYVSPLGSWQTLHNNADGSGTFSSDGFVIIECYYSGATTASTCQITLDSTDYYLKANSTLTTDPTRNSRMFPVKAGETYSFSGINYRKMKFRATNA